MKSSKATVSYQDTPELEKARAAFLTEEYEKSLRMFAKAVKRQPNNIMALTDAARAHGQRYEIQPALKLVQRMLTLAGDNAEVQFLAGQTLRMIHRSDEALEHFKKAAQIGEAHPDVHLEIAVLLERRHQLEQALEQVEKFLAKEKNNTDGTLLKARILRRSGEVEQAAGLYEALSSSNGCIQHTRAEALNEWANLLDSQQDHTGAFEKLRESKTLLADLPETKPATNRCEDEHKWWRNFTDSVTPEYLARWMERPPTEEHQSVLLTGCPRSGTTLIEKILDAHPGVISADELGAFTSYILPGLLKGKRDKDGFFDAETLDQLTPFRLRKQEQRYFRYLQDALNEEVGGRILVDKNPSVTFMIPVHQRVWPQNRILYALRDPRDIAISCFFRWLPLNSMSVRFHTLEDTCKRTAEELGCWLRLREMLPRDRWHETRYENTVADYTKESRKVLEWMGLPWDDSVQNYRAHLEKRGVNSPTYAAVNQKIYKGAIGRWKNYAEELEPHLPILQPYIEAFGYA